MIESKRHPGFRTTLVYSSRTCCIALLLALIFTVSQAQQPGLAANPANSPAVSSGGESLSSGRTDARYRIGPGDVLEVRVLRAPELSREGVRVDQSGMIRMPMLDIDIQAACLTEAELAANIARLYLKYKREPHVEVFVKEFQSQPVAVIGAVRGPAQFKLQRPVRLSELLSFAGGPSETAGQTVQVVHAGGVSLCDKSSSRNLEETSDFVSYKLIDTLHAVPEANPFVRPGDLVQVPTADQVYVVGNVLRPLAIPLKEPLTVSKAIAIAGGTAPSTKKDKVKIIRQLPGSGKQEIHIDLKAIEKNQAEDVALLANDIVDVPISGTKSLLRSLVGAIVPSVGQLPVRVIP
jgi:polysaccharide export outer membrane protein